MKLAGNVLIFLFALVLIVPLFWMVKGSFTPAIGVLKIPPDLVPRTVTLSNYRSLFFRNPILLWTFNSAVVAIVVVCGTVLCSTAAGYAFARLKVPGEKIIFWAFLSVMLIPGQIGLIPVLVLIRKMGIYNTLWAMILPGLFSPMFIFLYRSYVLTVPGAFFDSAEMDGCGKLDRFFRILWPLTRPAIATMAIMAFVGTWNNFLWQLIVVNKEELRTVSVGIALISKTHKLFDEFGFVNYGLLMAGAVYAFVPMLLIFILAQKHFVQSLYAGGMR